MTFLRSFCRGNNLRALIPLLKMPQIPLFSEYLARLREIFTSTSPGTYVTDLLAHASADGTGQTFTLREDKLNALEEETYHLLLQRVNADADHSSTFASYLSPERNNTPLDHRGQFLKKVKKDGVNFNNSSTISKAIGNSFISFLPLGKSSPAMGQISEIFVHRRKEHNKMVTEPFLVIQEFQPLASHHERHDPFRKIEHLDAMMFYNQFRGERHVIKLSDVVSHVATLAYTPEGINEECVVALSLDRVSFRLISLDSQAYREQQR